MSESKEISEILNQFLTEVSMANLNIPETDIEMVGRAAQIHKNYFPTKTYGNYVYMLYQQSSKSENMNYFVRKLFGLRNSMCEVSEFLMNEPDNHQLIENIYGSSPQYIISLYRHACGGCNHFDEAALHFGRYVFTAKFADSYKKPVNNEYIETMFFAVERLYNLMAYIDKHQGTLLERIVSAYSMARCVQECHENGTLKTQELWKDEMVVNNLNQLFQDLYPDQHLKYKQLTDLGLNPSVTEFLTGFNHHVKTLTLPELNFD